MTAPLSSPAGFSLVEALIAAALVAGAGAALAQLVALGTRQTTTARSTLESLVAAQSKLEELRAATWSYNVAGSNLQIAPAGSLLNDAPGFSDRLGPFARRWSVAYRDAADPDVVVINVCAFDSPAVAAPAACVTTMRTRRP